jgi:small subunit ribosomal protein S11
LAAQKAIKKAINEYGVQEVEIWVKGPGAGRESALRAIISSDVKVSAIRDVTPIPHNGCRPPARRRV